MNFTNTNHLWYDVYHIITSEEYAVEVFQENVVEYLYWDVRLKISDQIIPMQYKISRMLNK